MQSGDYKVADISLADFGRREIELAEHEVSIGRKSKKWKIKLLIIWENRSI